MLLLGLLSLTTYAQDTNIDTHTIALIVPEVALLDLESATGTAISLGVIAPTEAGLPVTFSSANTDLWLNYSSIIGSITEPSRNITVQVTAGTIPDGIDINLVALADAGNGDGTIGTPTTSIILSTATAQNLVTGIGSAYTGDGVNNGHNLSYTGGLSSSTPYSELDFDQNAVLTVTYTLTDN